MENNDEIFKKLKVFGNSNSVNVFFELLEKNTKIDEIKKTLVEIENSFSICEKCFYVKKNGLCFFCDEESRDNTKICIVSSLYDAYKIYNIKYDGLIHVLHEDLKIETNNDSKIVNIRKRLYNVKELILALNLTFEGEVVSNFLKKEFEKEVEKVSRIAQGIPFGGSLNYADYETLSMAIFNRKKFK